ncbi:hypothetical protein [Nioella ostreopsis]|nr:hypothetical protein [Nioella ostreopsis]
MRNFLTVLFVIFLILPMRVMADDDATAEIAPLVTGVEISAQQ